MPGLVKELGGVRRMRFVKPGFDPNDLDLDFNNVVFDSDAVASLPIHRSGIFPVAGNTTTWPAADTWPSLGYIPLFVWGYSAGTPRQYQSMFITGGSASIEMRTDATGIYVYANGISPYPVYFNYIVFKVASG